MPVSAALVSRARPELGELVNSVTVRLSQVVLVAEPTGDWPPVHSVHVKVDRVAPVVNHDRGGLDPAGARARYGIDPHEDLIVVSLGGGDGADAADMLRVTLAALRRHNARHRIIAVTGPLFDPSALATLHLEARDRSVTLVQTDAHLSDLFAAARLVVSVGGYNSVVEALDVGAPLLCVPLTDEATRRAAALVDAGFPVCVAPAEEPAIVSGVHCLLAGSVRKPFEPGPSAWRGAEEAASVLLKALWATPESEWHQPLRTSSADRGVLAYL